MKKKILSKFIDEWKKSLEYHEREFLKDSDDYHAEYIVALKFLIEQMYVHSSHPELDVLKVCRLNRLHEIKNSEEVINESSN